MLTSPPRPDLWTRIAALIAALRLLLRDTAPGLFQTIAAEARAQLAAANALVRRYIHVLAADIALPPPVEAPARPSGDTPPTPRRHHETLFRLSEDANPFSSSRTSETSDPPDLQWALMVEAVRRLTAVMANPGAHALRLARHLRKGRAELRALPVTAATLRRLPPWTDALICRLDEEARPEAWAAIRARGPPPSAG